jgi:hypothetical protein
MQRLSRKYVTYIHAYCLPPGERMLSVGKDLDIAFLGNFFLLMFFGVLLGSCFLGSLVVFSSRSVVHTHQIRVHGNNSMDCHPENEEEREPDGEVETANVHGWAVVEREVGNAEAPRSREDNRHHLFQAFVLEGHEADGTQATDCSKDKSKQVAVTHVAGVRRVAVVTPIPDRVGHGNQGGCAKPDPLFRKLGGSIAQHH